MRDHTKLAAFHKADELVLAVYRVSRRLPPDERFGLISQMRRAVVSVASNIVEGCVQETEASYLNFLNIAFGSLREVTYQLSLSFRLGFLTPAVYEPVRQQADECSRILAALIRSLRKNSHVMVKQSINKQPGTSKSAPNSLTA